MAGDVIAERTAAVVRVTLNRPDHRNAMTYAAWDELADTLRVIARSDARVVIVTGAGTDFCLGGDLAGTDRAPHPLGQLTNVAETCQLLFDLPQVTIARVDGVAAGAGLGLALGCDFVVATARARFATLFTKRGLSPDFGASWILPRLVGLQRAKELVLLGEVVTAQRALILGLVTRVVDAEDLDATVDQLAADLAQRAPIATRLAKQLLNSALSSTLDDALRGESWSQSVNRLSADATEGAQAYLERRPPQFRGR